MRERLTPNTNMPSKNQDICVTIKGKEHYICSSKQMDFVRSKMLARVYDVFRDKGEPVPSDQAELARLVDVEVEKTGYATIDMILAKMTPYEQEQWKAQYRFGGMWGKRR